MKTGRLEKVLLYDEGADPKLNIEETAEYLREKLPRVAVEIRAAFPRFSQEEQREFARWLAAIKITDVTRKMAGEQEPLYGEIEFEMRRIQGKTRAFGVIYDGFQLVRRFSELIAPAERDFALVHIFFTNRLFATWGSNDMRYHARTSIYGFPSIISTTGLVEAPAKPREYYLLKQQYEMLGKDIQEVKEKFRGSFIDYEDELLTEVVKGYAMQAVFYALNGDPYCEDRGCRLFNAHWQADLIFAQLESGYEYCQRHSDFLSGFS